MHREPEVPEAEVPVEEWLDCRARITLEELAITHFVKNGTLQNACSTRSRVVAGLEQSARMHILRLMNNLAKGPKKNDDKDAVAVLKITRQLVGLRISRYGAAEVFIDFTEELKHTEANPTCSIHQSHRTSR